MVYLPTKPIAKNGKKRQISNGKNKVLGIPVLCEKDTKPPGVAWETSVGITVLCGKDTEKHQEFPDKKRKTPGVAWEKSMGITVLCGKDTEKPQEFTDKKRKTLVSTTFLLSLR